MRIDKTVAIVVIGALTWLFLTVTVVLTVVQPKRVHKCYDPTHMECDGNCTCDGMECTPDPRSYQIEVTNDSIYLYDRDKLVKVMLFTDDSEIGQAIMEDNQ